MFDPMLVIEADLSRRRLQTCALETLFVQTTPFASLVFRARALARINVRIVAKTCAL